MGGSSYVTEADSSTAQQQVETTATPVQQAVLSPEAEITILLDELNAALEDLAKNRDLTKMRALAQKTQELINSSGVDATTVGATPATPTENQ